MVHNSKQQCFFMYGFGIHYTNQFRICDPTTRSEFMYLRDGSSCSQFPDMISATLLKSQWNPFEDFDLIKLSY